MISLISPAISDRQNFASFSFVNNAKCVNNENCVISLLTQNRHSIMISAIFCVINSN